MDRVAYVQHAGAN